MEILDFLNEEELQGMDPSEAESIPSNTEYNLISEEEDETVEETLSNNEIVEILKNIDEKIERIEENEIRVEYVPVYVDNDINDDVDNISSNTLTVSEDNILSKSINDYTTQESLLLINFIMIFFAIVFIGIRKAVIKWK